MMTCNLEWKNQSAFLVQALSSLRQNDTLTDCTLAADGRHIKAHRLILCACSPYFKVTIKRMPTYYLVHRLSEIDLSLFFFFKDLLSGHADKQAIIFLNNVNFSLLKLIVEYIYKGCVNIDHTELQKFLQTARALKISGLVNYGEEEPQSSKKHPAPPKLLQKPSQKRSLQVDTSSAPPKMNKIAKREGTNSTAQRPSIRPKQPTMMNAPSAPDDIQAAYLTLELEVEAQDENLTCEVDAEDEEPDENMRTDENIPFVPGMSRR